MSKYCRSENIPFEKKSEFRHVNISMIFNADISIFNFLLKVIFPLKMKYGSFQVTTQQIVYNIC